MTRREPVDPIKTEQSPNAEYIRQKKERILDYFEGDEKAKEQINKAIDILEKKDAEFHEEVPYHGPKHVLSMAENALKSVEAGKLNGVLAEKFSLEQITRFKKLLALASILHDMGYYSECPDLPGVRKVGHEDRSIEFIRENKELLGIEDDEEIEEICCFIEGSKFGVPLADVKETNDLKEIGKAIVGVLDVLGADDDYVRLVGEGLYKEFKGDKEKLASIIAQKYNKAVDGIDTFLNQRAQFLSGNQENDPAIIAFKSIPLENSPLEQVKNSIHFFEFVFRRISTSALVKVNLKEMMYDEQGSLLAPEVLQCAQRSLDTIKACADGKVPEELGHLLSN